MSTFTSIDEGREIIQRIYRSTADGTPVKLRAGKITREYREHAMRLFALELGAPYPRPLKLIAADLGVSTLLLRKWRKSEQFMDICDEVQDYLFRKYEILIMGKVIEKALEGNKWFVDTFLTMRGRMKQQIEVTHKNGVPMTKEAVDAELKELSEKSPELRSSLAALVEEVELGSGSPVPEGGEA